ncbi:hypothetical protein ACFUVV_17350 [Streptomyces sp. NPDC057376]|uniref:hypothetical protein n=1 Tax=unclassified Streptomyces TaxID=2593676 RepID=UPI00093C8D8E|nr:hypothetical protein [Streptomyces sp. CB02414]OKI87087.1 hypothetical protein AMK11_13395 [Streptomyces sp. CB02414]
MEWRRAAIPAVVGGLLLTAMLWWAGSSAQALHLRGTADALGGRVVADLERWLLPWSYDPPASVRFGTGVIGEIADPGGGDADRYLGLYRTALQIRFTAVFVFFVPGAVLLVRRLPPVRGRVPAALLALWAWGLVAGMLAVTVSAPWLIAAEGRGSYRFLPQLAAAIAAGRQILVLCAVVAALGTVLVARFTSEASEAPARQRVSVPAGRLSASVGTAVVALSLVVLSYESVAATVQTAFAGSGLFAEPGELLRQWLLLGGWAGPGSGTSVGDWLLQRTPDVLLLAVVWWALRLLPGLLTRATLPAMAVGAVCATVLGLLASQLLRALIVDGGLRWGLTYLSAGLGSGVPAALTFGLVAGAAATLALRMSPDRSAHGGD